LGDDCVHLSFYDRLNARLERRLPERRLFLKTEAAGGNTRMVRLRPVPQAAVLAGAGAVMAWTALATAFVLLGAISAGDARDQAARAQAAYEDRIAGLAQEREVAHAAAERALARYDSVLDEFARMQEALLGAEQRRAEVERTVEIVQRSLQRALAERDAARAEVAGLSATLGDAPLALAEEGARRAEAEALVAALTDMLGRTAGTRDDAVALAEDSEAEIARMRQMAEAVAARNERIFTSLEEAVETSVEPLRKVFERSGISPDAMLEQVRRGYDGIGGPLEPLVVSTRGQADVVIDPDTGRANRILGRLEEVDLHRIVAESLPLAHPVPGPHRVTSGFGPRWGRMHSGQDFAGARGSRINATADGTVTFAGWQSGYGKLVKIEHPFGFETRYAHLSSIDVRVGQRVSRGQHIGGMGTTGRSTGVHLHYEVRRRGEAMNPTIFLSAGRDVY
jgi:murein DD-endopeptidase MepM/ murein hydrolase activator NlpD